MDPQQEQTECFPCLSDLGEAPALFQDAVSSSSLGHGRAPALENLHDDKSSVSNSVFSSEGHMSSKYKLSNVVTQLSIAVASLQECITTLVEFQSDSFNQQDAPARLRESSLGSLNSSRANNNKTQKERSNLGELTPRTCKNMSEETGSHPEFEPDELEQRGRTRTRRSRNRTAYCTAKGPPHNNSNNSSNNRSLLRSRNSFQNTKDGATYAGREDTQQKLAGTMTSGKTSSTTQLG